MALITADYLHRSPLHRTLLSRMREVAPLLVWACFALDAIVALASLVSYAICTRLHVEPLEFFRLGQEYNLPTWYSSFQHAIVGLLLLSLALREISIDIKRFAICLPALMFLFFSLDETAMIHERIGALVGAHSKLNDQHGLATGPAMIVCLPLALAGTGLILLLTKRYWLGRGKMAFKFALGLGIFFLSAGGLELLSNLFAHHMLLIKLETFVEETGEMVGTTIVLWASLELLAAEKLAFHFTSDGLHFE